MYEYIQWGARAICENVCVWQDGGMVNSRWQVTLRAVARVHPIAIAGQLCRIALNLTLHQDQPATDGTWTGVS
jgi:hypothetical protein